MARLYILLLTVLLVSSCVQTNVYRTEPESLLNSSSENISFGIVSDMSVDSIANWIKDDKPTEAIFSCVKSDFLCVEAQALLKKNSVPFIIERSYNGDNTLTLIYERISARDCHGGLGCSVSANMLQSVTNRSNFIKPPLSDPQDAKKAVDNYNDYFGK